MPEHQRQLGLGELTIDDVEIGAADAAAGDLDQDLPRGGLRVGQLAFDQRLPRRFEDHGAHELIVSNRIAGAGDLERRHHERRPLR